MTKTQAHFAIEEGAVGNSITRILEINAQYLKPNVTTELRTELRHAGQEV